MASCAHEKTFLYIPPTAAFIKQYYPSVTPNAKIDRTIPRCKLCDLIKAQERATIAENPPPGIDMIERIEIKIRMIEQLIAANIATKKDEEDLAELRLELDNAIADCDARIHEAWVPYWQIWGADEGPESPVNSLFDEGEDLIDWGDA